MTKPTYFIILIFACYAISSTKAITCSTIANAISNVTDCVGSTCTVQYSTLITADLFTGYSACLKFAAISNGNTTFVPETNFNLTISQAGYSIPLELQYVTGDYKPTHDSNCNCDFFESVNSCSGMSFQNTPRITGCLIKRQQTTTCLIHGVYAYAQYYGLDIDQRFKMFLTRNPSLDVNMHFTYGNISSGLVWNAETPTHVNINSQMGFDLLSSSHDPVPTIPRYLVYDMRVPYDLYDATGFNQPGEYSPEKPGSSYWLPDGTFKTKSEWLEEKFQSILELCHHDKTQTNLDLLVPNIQSVLENMRIAKNSIRNSFPTVLYYDENTYATDAYWTSMSLNPTHLIEKKTTGTDPVLNNYIQALNANFKPVVVGTINTQGYFGDSTTQASTNQQFTILDCNYGNFLIKCDGSAGWSWYDGSSSSWSTAMNNYTDWQGNCRSTIFGNFPLFTPIHDDSHSLFLPFVNIGSMNIRVSGKLPGITFTTQLCPDILSVRDDPYNHAINMTARSTCGAGNVIITSNNSMSHSSDSLSLTSTYQNFIIPRNFNISGYVQIGLASGSKYKTVVLFLNYFPYVDPIDDNGDHSNPDTNPQDNQGSNGNSIFGSWHDFWNNVKDAFHWKWLDWKSILFKIVFLIIFIVLLVLTVVLLFKIISWIVKRALLKKKVEKLHQF